MITDQLTPSQAVALMVNIQFNASKGELDEIQILEFTYVFTQIY